MNLFKRKPKSPKLWSGLVRVERRTFGDGHHDYVVLKPLYSSEFVHWGPLSYDSAAFATEAEATSAAIAYYNEQVLSTKVVAR